MKRKDFLKTGALATLAGFGGTSLFSSTFLTHSLSKLDVIDEAILQRLRIANDKVVGELLKSIKITNTNFSRKIGYDFTALAAAYISPSSKYFHSHSLISKMDILTKVLKRYQTEDGTVNIGNLESPPDTAFLVELLAGGAHILLLDNSPALSEVSAHLKHFLIRSGEALAVGGVHTPNHRWVISAALAKLYALWPDKRYTDRIEEWISEGVYNDSEGHYPERSAIYSYVENNAFITLSRILNRPELLEPVRKNLAMMYHYIEPNGDLVTNVSRRQDQYRILSVTPYYHAYRYMGIIDNNKHFASIAKFIESLGDFEKLVLNNSLFQFQEETILQQILPSVEILNTNYEKLFQASHLLRIRRKNTTATLFGGVDWPLTIASGRSNSPNFFSYRKGQAILRYARLSSDFFSMGYFYSDGLTKVGDSYILSKNLEVPYYQPIPKHLQNQAGDYTLTPSIDNRFWNKMDFEKRPVSNVKKLSTTVSMVEKNGNCELEFVVEGLNGIAVTIELCFDEGGKLSGTTTEKNGNNFLEKGYGSYTSEGDTIHFGPGNLASKSVDDLEGERYSTHFGSLRTQGKHVYITGVTPFKHTLIFK